MDICAEAQRKILFRPYMGELGILYPFLYPALHYGEGQAFVPVQYSASQIYHLWTGVLATGFFHFWFDDDRFYRVHRLVYRRLWAFVLRMGLSADHLYGDALPQTGIPD